MQQNIRIQKNQYDTATHPTASSTTWKYVTYDETSETFGMSEQVADPCNHCPKPRNYNSECKDEDVEKHFEKVMPCVHTYTIIYGNVHHLPNHPIIRNLRHNHY
ncbi:uncharacterized protein CELE_D1044.4 [Caenorhabditis elegans]|uniref:Uncharacterized protein D1044.4 n=1 Tax=Caenorhabditis elegans TaxID=6239 RepID=YLK4_CAEEL|nr:Uncharacterized protein CELE_D1044.4 [Caenorhabditis elegans]P41952.1 RecName: Full=Uncharacterized protein D1044.4 [Caenorhabditis elegans]CCD68372.1 Uncharacterized protein CELE_D1044.4 [Caenorhabditis elegans]|eukprot:NP_498179.1 Uncharacterized protein CELE_D1044.4 [Caenorhabditis elegans]